jgi:hypothetical protein
MPITLLASVLPLVVLAWPGAASGWDLSGYMGVESRLFLQDHRFPDQQDGAEASLILSPEWIRESADRRQQFSLIPFYRADSQDSKRTHFDLREAYWLYRARDWELLAGFNKVFWGVAESRHLVDIINQTDLVEDIDQEDKLGQPMIHLVMLRDWGTLSLFVLPGFRERTFPGKNGRLRTPLPVDTHAARYTSSQEQWHVDYALRYAHYVGDWDFGIYHFYGTSREPRLVPNATGSRFIPVYELIQQTGLDLQYTVDAWLWKFEGILRYGQGDTFAATVAGVEYTLFQVAETRIDIGLLFEYLYDGRDEEAPPVVFDHDIFLGTRLAFNDVQDTEVLAGVVFDPDTGERFFNVEAERRIGDRISAEFRARFFSGADAEDLFYSFEQDDYLQLRLAWYF